MYTNHSFTGPYRQPDKLANIRFKAYKLPNNERANYRQLALNEKTEILNESLGLYKSDDLNFRDYFKNILYNAIDRLDLNEYDTKLFKTGNSKFCVYTVDDIILQQISPILKKLSIYIGYCDGNILPPGDAVAVVNDTANNLAVSTITLYKENIVDGITFLEESIILSYTDLLKPEELISNIHHELLHIKHSCSDTNLIKNNNDAYNNFSTVLSNMNYSMHNLSDLVSLAEINHFYKNDIIAIFAYLFYITDKSEKAARLENIYTELKDAPRKNYVLDWIANKVQDKNLKQLCKSFTAAEYIFYRYFLKSIFSISELDVNTQNGLCDQLISVNPGWKHSKCFKYNKAIPEFNNLVEYLLAQLSLTIKHASKLLNIVHNEDKQI